MWDVLVLKALEYRELTRPGSLSYLLHLAKCLAGNKHSINICWRIG
jgi:hypothetical protein